MSRNTKSNPEVTSNINRDNVDFEDDDEGHDDAYNTVLTPWPLEDFNRILDKWFSS